jgi:hypothetical protein
MKIRRLKQSDAYLPKPLLGIEFQLIVSPFLSTIIERTIVPFESFKADPLKMIIDLMKTENEN